MRKVKVVTKLRIFDQLHLSSSELSFRKLLTELWHLIISNCWLTQHCFIFNSDQSGRSWGWGCAAYKANRSSYKVLLHAFPLSCLLNRFLLYQSFSFGKNQTSFFVNCLTENWGEGERREASKSRWEGKTKRQLIKYIGVRSAKEREESKQATALLLNVSVLSLVSIVGDARNGYWR